MNGQNYVDLLQQMAMQYRGTQLRALVKEMGRTPRDLTNLRGGCTDLIIWGKDNDLSPRIMAELRLTQKINSDFYKGYELKILNKKLVDEIKAFTN